MRGLRLRDRPALDIAIAIACFWGRPLWTSSEILADTTLRDKPCARGIRLSGVHEDGGVTFTVPTPCPRKVYGHAFLICLTTLAKRLPVLVPPVIP